MNVIFIYLFIFFFFKKKKKFILKRGQVEEGHGSLADDKVGRVQGLEVGHVRWKVLPSMGEGLFLSLEECCCKLYPRGMGGCLVVVRRRRRRR